MSFTLQVTTDKKSSYPLFNVVEDSISITVDATFTISKISSLVGNTCIAEYLVTINGKQGAANTFEFTYSGSGNPLDEAEVALKASLSS